MNDEESGRLKISHKPPNQFTRRWTMEETRLKSTFLACILPVQITSLPRYITPTPLASVFTGRGGEFLA